MPTKPTHLHVHVCGHDAPRLHVCSSGSMVQLSPQEEPQLATSIRWGSHGLVHS